VCVSIARRTLAGCTSRRSDEKGRGDPDQSESGHSLGEGRRACDHEPQAGEKLYSQGRLKNTVISSSTVAQERCEEGILARDVC
jgi:hypothetical protein